MYLYRALNSDDLKSYNECGAIFSSLFYNITKDIVSDDVKEYGNTCFKGNFSVSLDSIINHVDGHRVSSDSSPWISASTDFNYTAFEYAIPQTGKNNKMATRKPIALIKIKDDKVLDNSNDIKRKRDTILNDNCVVDLRCDNLALFKYEGAIQNAFENEADIIELTKAVSDSSEALVYNQVYKEEIKEIIYPIMQDILYSTEFFQLPDANILLDNYFSFIKNIIMYNLKENDYYFMNILYPSYKEGINLTDFLIEHYDRIKGNTIEEKYESLKIVKKYAIEGIVKDINKILSLCLSVKKIVDDGISVISYDRLVKYDIRDISNLVVLEKDGDLYKYNSLTDSYNSLNGDFINKEDLVAKICNVQKIKRR